MCGKINFAHGALVGNVGVDVVAVVLLTIQGIMLYRGDDALRLDAFDPWNDHGCVQKWIFREVLEVAAGEWRTGDVDAGTEQEVDTAGARILAKALAEFTGELRVPGGGQRCTTPPAYAVVGPQVRTPTEASDILKRGRSIADSACVYMSSTPPTSSSFCSSVSLAIQA